MLCERLPFVPDSPDDDLVLLHQFHVSETYAFHSHEFYEVFYVIRGQAMHEINGSSQVVSEGSLVFIRPDDRHYYQYLNIYDFEFINVNISISLTEESFRWLRLPRELFDSPALPPTLHLSGAQHMEMRRKFISLAEMVPGEARRRAFCAMFPEVLLLLHDQPAGGASPIVPKWLSDVLKKLDQPQCFAQGLPELLRSTPYTQEHLTRSFRKYVHTSPTAYINQKRLGYAAELLTTESLTPPQVAARVGFNNLSHFYHLFRQQYGCTPLQFSQQYRDMRTDQAQYLALISKNAVLQCMNAKATRIPLEDGLFAYYMQDGKAQIYISFANDATAHNLNELTSCWDPRLNPGSTVHINRSNYLLLKHLCSKFHCRPARQIHELTLSRAAFLHLSAPMQAENAALRGYDLALDEDYLALIDESGLEYLCEYATDADRVAALKTAWRSSAKHDRFLALYVGGELAGLSWFTQDELCKLVLHPSYRRQGLARYLLHESARRIFDTGEHCTLYLPDTAENALHFFKAAGFTQAGYEAVIHL